MHYPAIYLQTKALKLKQDRKKTLQPLHWGGNYKLVPGSKLLNNSSRKKKVLRPIVRSSNGGLIGLKRFNLIAFLF